MGRDLSQIGNTSWGEEFGELICRMLEQKKRLHFTHDMLKVPKRSRARFR